MIVLDHMIYTQRVTILKKVRGCPFSGKDCIWVCSAHLLP